MKKLCFPFAALLLTSCGPFDFVENHELDAWCGDRPCGWRVEGEIERVSTWHSDDYAVALVSDGARLDQLSEEGTFSSPCMSFSLLARVPENAELFIELDFMDDGSIEWSKRIETSDYAPVSFEVIGPSWYESVRFIVRKEGAGRVEVARLRVQEGLSSCVSSEEIMLTNLAAGTPCEHDSECADDACTGGVCAGCTSDDDCDDGDICGYEAAQSATLSLLCIERPEKPIGEICRTGAECGSGICCEGLCSSCCDDPSEQCGRADAVCARPELQDDDDLLRPIPPFVCDPGAGLGASGSYCSQDEDCMSGTCEPSGCGVDGCGQSVIGSFCGLVHEQCDEGAALCTRECDTCAYSGCFVELHPGGTCR